MAQHLPDGAVALLRELVIAQRDMAAELRALRQAQAAMVAGYAPEATTALLAAIYAVAGNREFYSAQLIEMASGPGAPERTLHSLLEPRSAVGVGVLLQSMVCQVCPSTGLVLSTPPGRAGRRGRRWRVSPTHTHANR